VVNFCLCDIKKKKMTTVLSVLQNVFVGENITSQNLTTNTIFATEASLDSITCENINSDTLLYVSAPVVGIGSSTITFSGSMLTMNDTTQPSNNAALKIGYLSGLSTLSYTGMYVLSNSVTGAFTGVEIPSPLKTTSLSTTTLGCTVLTCNSLSTMAGSGSVTSPFVNCNNLGNFGTLTVPNNGQSGVKLGVYNTSKDTTVEGFPNGYSYNQQQFGPTWVISTADGVNNSAAHDILVIGSIESTGFNPDHQFSLKQNAGVIINPSKIATTAADYDSALRVRGQMRIDGGLALFQTLPITDVAYIGWSRTNAFSQIWTTGNTVPIVRNLGFMSVTTPGVYLICIVASINHASGTPANTASCALCPLATTSPTTIPLRAQSNSLDTITTSGRQFTITYTDTITSDSDLRYVNFVYSNSLATSSVTTTATIQMTRIA
jgi:hypothetical protein